MGEMSREYEKAVDYICGEIRDGRIREGDRLPTERTLADRLHISRNSTREALRSLEHMGIVRSVRGSGSYYTGDVAARIAEMLGMLLRIRRVEVLDLCRFRRMMEKAVCFTLLTQGGAALDDLAGLPPEPPEDLAEETELDCRFHFELIRRTENQFLAGLMSGVTDVYRAMIAAALAKLDPAEKAVLWRTHGEMLDALRQGDRAGCEVAIDRHYDIIESILGSGAPEERRGG